MEKLATKKKIFYEPKDSGQVEQTLREYAAAVHSNTVTLDFPEAYHQPTDYLIRNLEGSLQAHC